MVILLFALSFNAHCPFLSWLSRCRPVYLRLATSYKFSAFFNSAILCMIFLAESRPYSLMSELSVFMIFSILLFFASTFIYKAIIKPCLKKASLFLQNFLKHQKTPRRHVICTQPVTPIRFRQLAATTTRKSTFPPRVGHGAPCPMSMRHPALKRAAVSSNCCINGAHFHTLVSGQACSPGIGHSSCFHSPRSSRTSCAGR